MQPRNTHEKILMTTKYSQEKISDSRNTHEKKKLDPQNTHDKNFVLTKYPQEKIFDPQNTHEKKLCTHEIPTKTRWHDGTKITRPTMACDTQNLAHSLDDKSLFVHQF